MKVEGEGGPTQIIVVAADDGEAAEQPTVARLAEQLVGVVVRQSIRHAVLRDRCRPATPVVRIAEAGRGFTIVANGGQPAGVVIAVRGRDPPRPQSGVQTPSRRVGVCRSGGVVVVGLAVEPAAIRVVVPGRDPCSRAAGKAGPVGHCLQSAGVVVAVSDRVGARAVGLLQQPIREELVGHACAVRRDDPPGPERTVVKGSVSE